MSIEDVRARVARAKQQTDVLRTESTASLGRCYRVVATPYGDTSEVWRYEIRLVQANGAPPLRDWAFMAGEITHNLRASLDNLAWLLAGATADENTHFPIADDPDRWAKCERRMIGMPPDAIKAIAGLQPFRGERYRPLATLRELSNSDKHRTLQTTMTAAAPGPPAFGPVMPEHVGKSIKILYSRPPGQFSDETVLQRVEMPTNMDMVPAAIFELIFGDRSSMPNVPVLRTFEHLATLIESEIIPQLAAYASDST